ncbi:MAG TPA: M1 family aminopeptidase [Sandaracinaceae bacterium]
MPHRHHCAHARCFADERASTARPFRLPGDRPQWGRPRAYSLDALRLSIDLDLEAEAIDAEAELTLRRVDAEARWAELDAIAFELASVERERAGAREPAAYDYDGEVLRVDLSDLPVGGEALVRVRYRATPQRGLYFTAPDASRPDRPRQVWSQCQDQDGRHWFPCQDHPGQRMRTELSVRVPRGWFALSNGVLVERRDEGERTRFTWAQREPHPAYLVTLAAGEFHEVHTRAGDVPVSYYVPKGREGDVERSLGRTPEMIRVFAERLATPYPWDKYAQVVVADFIFGGMENTSATTLFERVLLDERAALDVDMDALVAHELAHQWFGDLVTCRHWSHAWLNEGFATYMEHVWKEHREGRDAYFYNLEQDLELYLAEHGSRYGRPIVENVWAAPIDVFDRHLYQKGGLVLHALRQHLGDDAFWRGLAFYLERHRGGSVETRDLMRALEDATGRSLEAFFHQWVERPGHPALEVAVETGEGTVKIAVTQTQAKDDEGVFRIGLPIVVVGADGRSERRVLELSRREESFTLATSERPAMVIVDPEMSAPGTVALRVPLPMLEAQLARGPWARARWVAARALGESIDPRATRALAAALRADSFWAVRAEAAKALGEQRVPAALDALLEAPADPDPHVRRAVAGALGKYRGEARAAERVLSLVEKGDPSYLVEAELRKSLGALRDPRALEVLARSLREDRGTWGDVVSAGAAEGLGQLASAEAIPPLVAALEDVTTTPSVRRAALSALASAREAVSDRPTLRRIREVAEQQLSCFDPNVRIAVARLLAALGDAEGAPVLERVARTDLDGRVRRAAREARRDLSSRLAAPPELHALRDEVEKLRKEVRELRAELAAARAAAGR